VIRINLMPREERAKKRKMPTVKLPPLGAAVPLVILGVVGTSIGFVHALQQRELKRLDTEIAALRAESESYKPQLEKIRQITQKRQDVTARLDIIANLDQERYFRVKLMDEVARSVPENLWLSKVAELPDKQFAIEGVTFSNFIVARFMQDLEATGHWQNVELSVAQQGKIDGYDVVQFSMVSGAQP
jgi:type IV pilus assembly protein PilN